jgi:hypothetical protein
MFAGTLAGRRELDEIDVSLRIDQNLFARVHA